MAEKLATYVHVSDSNGKPAVFGPDDAVPGWAIPLITNPAAWAGGVAPQHVTATDEPPLDPEDPAVAGEPAADEEELSSPPPRKGKGSSIEAWRAYAADAGYETDDDATRDEIIATLEADGIPVE